VDEEMEAGEEELVDYDEDPMVAEKLEMAAIEKRVESRALKLLENEAINIQTDDLEAGKGDGNNKREAKNLKEGAKNYVEKGMEGKENTINTNSTEDDDEIDWDQVQDALDTNEVVDLTKVKKKKSQQTVLRRSDRTKNDCERIQDKAEEVKRKTNELTGKTSTFTVLSSIDACTLEKLAIASNIKLGNTVEQVSTSISTIQAKELAKAALHAAKKRAEEQKEQTQLEGATTKSKLNENEKVDEGKEEELLERERTFRERD
jgi:hypothetical protein